MAAGSDRPFAVSATDAFETKRPAMKERDGIMTTTIVKHSKRTVRKPCNKCGSTSLYWAHDTAVSAQHCDECGVSGKWLLIEQDGTPHSLRCGKADSSGPAPEPKRDEAPADPFGEPEPKEAPQPVTPAMPPAGGNDAFAAFQALMASMAPKVDRADVEVMIKEQLANVIFPTRTVVQTAEGETREIDGKTHVKVADVMTDLLAGEHVMMVGPAGTGKSTIAEQAAEGLGLDYYSISLSPMTPTSQILGYMQATGDYVSTLFRQAYENGGVFHFDEIDNSHPSALAVINAALANGRMAFPDGMVKRHDDFRCVASANTYGRGADRAYVGRQQMDAATLDRFAIETVEVDDALESDLCHSSGLEAGKVTEVLTFIRKLRRNAERKKMTVVISPRASMGMCRLLAAGKPWADAVESRVRRGLSDQDWAKLND